VSAAITPVAPVDAGAVRELATVEPSGDASSLGDAFAHALKQASQAEQHAVDAADRFAKDDPGMGIHEVMIASEQANIAVRYATTLKNKALEAYRELMNTQV